jgi:hypothetical protein
MKNLESDAFVFSGATEGLAYEQIFPALQAMITHGHFDMPIGSNLHNRGGLICVSVESISLYAVAISEGDFK